MAVKAHVRVLLVLLGAGASACGSSVTAPTPAPANQSGAGSPVSPGSPDPAFRVADVTLSGVVFEATPHGRAPLAGVDVVNGEGNYATTDSDGVYSMRPVWTCPCAAQPWVEAGTTFVWVMKPGYTDPPGTPLSVFGRGYARPGMRDVKIDGDTRFDIELVRQ
jgi:hypothetical protein